MDNIQNMRIREGYSAKNSLESIVEKGVSRLRKNAVQIMYDAAYYGGLAVFAGAVVQDYTNMGFAASTVFAAAGAGIAKGIHYVWSKYQPGIVSTGGRGQKCLEYGIAAGAVSLALGTEAYIFAEFEEGQAILERMKACGELGYLQLLSYSLLEAGTALQRGLQHLTKYRRKIVQKASYALSAAVIGTGILSAIGVVHPASLDTITPFIHEGMPMPIDSAKLPKNVELKKDFFGKYASMHLKRGESLYSAVVLRHTDYLFNGDVMDAAKGIMWRTYGIKNLWTGFEDVRPEDEIKIPARMLSERYRAGYKQPKRAKQPGVNVKKTAHARLSGIYVILDSGHGGTDRGASANRVIEDETAYDIAVRTGKLLEEKGAVVYYLVDDQSSQKKPLSLLQADTDEVLLTTPPHAMKNSRVSANLRIYLTNSIYHSLIARGIKPEETAFASFHVDALSREAQGMMVYFPESSLRKSHLKKTGKPYTQYAEHREDSTIEIEHDKETSEAQSHYFAQLLVAAAGSHDVKVGEVPVRGSIHRRRSTYVPAVIRWNPVPLKVLVEAGNCKNRADAVRLKSEEYRQRVAEMYADALLAYYRGGE